MKRGFLTVCALLVASGMGARAQAPETRIDQARQFSPPPTAGDAQTRETLADFPAAETIIQEDDAFGAQRILKEHERAKYFNAFAEASAFFTNNVALTNQARESDTFFVANFGLSYRRPISSHLQIEAFARGALFRYNEFNALDFNSLDVGAGITWTPPQLKGVALFARYTFTDLFNASSGDEFFQNHAIAVGAQKIFALSRTHAVFAGAVAQFGFADPSEAERDEYGAYLGYHWQALPKLQTDLFYRYAYFVYRGGAEDRSDHNQTLSLGLRYEMTDWMSLSASSFLGWNESNVDVFDYDVFNGGGGLGLSMRF